MHGGRFDDSGSGTEMGLSRRDSGCKGNTAGKRQILSLQSTPPEAMSGRQG